MGWSVGYDATWNRDIGYGVPATCDHPGCTAQIDRGLGYVCGNGEIEGGDEGCGLFFCGAHGGGTLCEVCADHQAGNDLRPFFKPSPDADVWVKHKLEHESWARWRDEHPDEVAAMRLQLEKGAST